MRGDPSFPIPRWSAGAVFDNPIVSVGIVSLITGLVLAGLARPTRRAWVAGLALPLVFAASYAGTYGGLPDFPPVGASSKIFYVAVLGGAIGLVLDIAQASAVVRRMILAVAPLAVAAWIALPRILALDIGTIVGALILWIVGAAILLRLDAINGDDRDGGGLVATATLMGLALAFAPVALNGGSSSSLTLCIGLAAGLGGTGLAELAAPVRPFTASALLGAGGGFLAAADSVTLITREEDVVALILVLLVPLAGAAAARLLPARWPAGRVWRQIAIGIAACVPVLIVVAALVARHDDPFPS